MVGTPARAEKSALDADREAWDWGTFCGGLLGPSQAVLEGVLANLDSDTTNAPRAVPTSVDARRAEQFMVAQTTLLALAFVTVTLANLSGMMNTLLFAQSLSFCAVMAVLSGLGWWTLRRTRTFQRLVLTLLCIDSVAGLLFFYLSGQFETPAVMVMSLIVIMTPLFGSNRQAWGIASLQVGLYSALLITRQHGWLDAVLPYGAQLPLDAVTDPSFVVGSLANFVLASFGLAYLAGQASLEIVHAKERLQDEVADKTAALRAAKGELLQANEELAALNGRLEATNAQLAVANQDLVQSNAQLGQFNAAVSHDLRSPLQTMVARAELVAALVHSNPDRAERMADGIIGSAQQMSLQIDELLNLATLGESLRHLDRVSVAAVVSKASQRLQERMRRSQARLELMHPLPHALGNSGLLQDLFQNLLENAIKYGDPDGALVRVEQATAPRGFVAVAVEDNGSGVPDDRHEHIFGLFKRLEPHTDSDGVGAGLAIVRRIVEVHGGQVQVQAGTHLGGARFVVVLKSPEDQPDLPAPTADRVH